MKKTLSILVIITIIFALKLSAEEYKVQLSMQPDVEAFLEETFLWEVSDSVKVQLFEDIIKLTESQNLTDAVYLVLEEYSENNDTSIDKIIYLPEAARSKEKSAISILVSASIEKLLRTLNLRLSNIGIQGGVIEVENELNIVLKLTRQPDMQMLKKVIESPGNIEFKLVYSDVDLIYSFFDIDWHFSHPGEEAPEGDIYGHLPEEDRYHKYVYDHPFTTQFVTYFVEQEAGAVPINFVERKFPHGYYVFQIQDNKIQNFFSDVSMAEVRELLPRDIEFYLSKDYLELENPEGTRKYFIYDIVPVKSPSAITTDAVQSAEAVTDNVTGKPIVTLQLKEEYTEKWREFTAANINKMVAIIFDDKVYSQPMIMNEITSGVSSISGLNDIQEAQTIAMILNSGTLKIPLTITEIK